MSENVSPSKVKAEIAAEITDVNAAPLENGAQESTSLIKKLIEPTKQAEKSRSSKYTRYTMDKESLKDASHALPSVYKFFLMIYRLSPVRTVIIIAVFLIQGLLPALRLRTGGDFIRQVIRFLE